TDVIAAEMGPIDALFLVPAFLEAGRITRDSVHYLVTGGVEVPVHETEFARDSVFGYAHSYLPEYVAEKTGGRIPADKVERLVLSDIRAGVLERLMKLTDKQCVVVDAETQDDLNRFSRDLLTAVSRGKRFLLRSAASVLTSLAGLPPQPVPAEDMARYVRSGTGAVIVGSHVQITTQQLEQLLTESTVAPVEVKVGYLLESAEGHAVLLKEAVARACEAHSQGKTPVVFTPREEIAFEDTQTRLAFGEGVSALLMDIVRGLPGDIGFLIAKGGITSNDVLSKGLELASARLLGQILPGVSMVRTGEEHPQFPNLPVVLFPGNVGDADALRTVYRRLASRS
ncbi:MAG: four-carbon acid sugar kinase family protein, partial [Gemmatimonadaceae bacterium]|nr:four-carbon acid sugar kinase family protein [Gloeobacterales cyanobacterium ES-bin-141]